MNLNRNIPKIFAYFTELQIFNKFIVLAREHFLLEEKQN